MAPPFDDHLPAGTGRGLDVSLRGLSIGDYGSSSAHAPTGLPGQVQNTAASPKSPHRRPNQRERRANQFTIPINDRAPVSVPRTGNPSPQQSPYTSTQSHVGAQSWRQQETRSAGPPAQQPFGRMQGHSHPSQGSVHAHPFPQPWGVPANYDGRPMPPQHMHHPQNRGWNPPQGPPLNQHRQHQFHNQQQSPYGQPHIPINPPMGYTHPGWNPQMGPHSRAVPITAPMFHQDQFHGAPQMQSGQLDANRTAKPAHFERQANDQSRFLEGLVQAVIPHVAVLDAEYAEKEAFRAQVEQICREAITKYEVEEARNATFTAQSVQLKPFGSSATDFAIKASDMDLALLTPQSSVSPALSGSHIPRILEKALLEAGYGARLLSKTRVPIIKLCEKPTAQLRHDLLKERAKFEGHDTDVVQEQPDESSSSGTPPIDGDKQQSSGTSTPMEAKTGHPLSGGTDVKRQFVSKPVVCTAIEDLRQTTEDGDLSLLDYYITAKSLLTHFDIDDAGLVTSQPKPLPETVRILESICYQFVDGLADRGLRNAIMGAKFMEHTVNRDSLPSNVRSLHSIHNLIEAVKTLELWSQRPFGEHESNEENAVMELSMNCENFILNDSESSSKMFNKKVHTYLGQLKAIPSIQLLCFEQSFSESAEAYYMRCKGLLTRLSSPKRPELEQILKRQYVDGIKDDNTRKLLESMPLDFLLLHQIYKIHRTLELIADYEAALSKNKYNPDQRSTIRLYLEYLRAYLSPPFDSQSHLHPVELTRDFYPVLQTIASLPSPSQIVHRRDRFKSHLEFPKSGVGIQSDINFAADLALHNTQLLRCYCAADERVKPMVLFIKHWAKRRGINTPYRGTLSSYGYVLMVLHYLVNIASPPVVPNLQLVAKDIPGPPQECLGCDVRFWRDEKELKELSSRGLLTKNTETVGSLLRGWFEYYGANGQMTLNRHPCFQWGFDVLSLRTAGGLVSKTSKGWVGAKTVIVPLDSGNASAPTPKPAASDGPVTDKTRGDSGEKKQDAPVKGETKEVRHKYLMAIEDPFELEHNVARTVNHDGICKIRDELRRAWRIIRLKGTTGVNNRGGTDDLLEEVDRNREEGMRTVLELVHGKKLVDEVLGGR